MSVTSRARAIGKLLPNLHHQKIVEDLKRYRLRPDDDHLYVAARRAPEFKELTCATCGGAYPAGVAANGEMTVSGRWCPNCYRAMWPPPEAWQLELQDAWHRRLEREQAMWKRMFDEPGWSPDVSTFPAGPLVIEDLAEKLTRLAPGNAVLVLASDREFGAYHSPVVVQDGDVEAKYRSGYRRLTEAEVDRAVGDPELELDVEEFGHSSSDD